MNKRLSHLERTLFLILLFYQMANASPLTPQQARYYEPVEIPAEVFASALGLPLKNLAIYSWENNNWKPILFQVDERTSEGNFIFTNGVQANPEQANQRLDSQDLLVFMAREAGEKAPQGELPAGAYEVIPIELIDPVRSESWWAYLALFPGPAPQAELKPISQLISKPNLFRFQFPTYEYDCLINYDGQKSLPTILINRLRILPEAGGNGKNIIDRQKIRGRITFLGGLIKIPINEKIAQGGIVAYKPGPVRVLTHSVMYPVFPLGIKGPKFYIDTILVDTLTLTYITMRVPFDPGFFIHDMTLSFGMDLSPEAKGMRYYNSVNQQGFLIDGKMDEAEKNFDPTKDKWRLITGLQGTQIISTHFDPKFLRNGKAFSTYNDDENTAHPPENFPGDIGSAFDTLVIKSLKPGTYYIRVFGCVPYNFYNPQGLNYQMVQSLLSLQSSPLIIKVNGQKITNQGALARPLFPP